MKIHIRKMFLRPHHIWKKFWSKFNFFDFWLFGGHQSTTGVTKNSILGVTNHPLGVTKNSIFGGHQSPPGVTKNSILGGHQKPLGVTKKKHVLELPVNNYRYSKFGQNSNFKNAIFEFGQKKLAETSKFFINS